MRLAIFPETFDKGLAVRLRRIAQRISRRQKLQSDCWVNLIVCGPQKIRLLNRTYRNLDRVTDVLSFVFDQKPGSGEIYICGMRARAQARTYRHSCDDEIVRLFVHGMFHLSGYDHATERERVIMEREERRYCTVPWKETAH